MGLNGPDAVTERAKLAAVVDDRRAQVAALKIRGFSIRQIRVEMAKSKHLNPKTDAPWSVGVITKDLAVLQARWRDEASRDTSKWHELELERLDYVEREAVEAWTRGIGKKQKTVTERNQGGRGGGSKARVETEELNGDPRYLAIILDCQQRRAKLLGLDSAEKLEHTGKDGGPIQFTDVERAEKVEAILATARNRIEAKE